MMKNLLYVYTEYVNESPSSFFFFFFSVSNYLTLLGGKRGDNVLK